jgi:hypothetical protein
VSIQAASQRLGLLPITVRRRIRKGELEAELHAGPKGDEYRVRLPGEYAGDQPESTQPSTQVLTDMLELITQQQAELRAMQADLVARAEDAATWKAKAELLEQQARSLERQVDEPRAELNRARRSWWRKPLG